MYEKNSFLLLYEFVYEDYTAMDQILHEIAKYQSLDISPSLPNVFRVRPKTLLY